MHMPMRVPANMSWGVSPQLRYDRRNQVLFACCILVLVGPPLVWVLSPAQPQQPMARAQATEMSLAHGAARARVHGAAAAATAPTAQG
jgi:hypothetical protein